LQRSGCEKLRIIQQYKIKIMKKLIPSIEYGKHLDSMEISDSEYRQQRQKYDAFLERPIQKSDCVTIDEDGNYIKEPKPSDYRLCDEDYDVYSEYLLKYNKAKEKVIFEGFECKYGLVWHKDNVIDDECFGITKNVDLSDWNLTLTKEF